MILTKEDVNFEFCGDFLIRAKDVANVLEYAQQKDFIKIVKEKYVYKIKNSNFAKSENRKLNNTGEIFISSLGLIQGLANSKMSKAEPFQDWLYEEVIPIIQKTGGYVNNDDLFINSYLPFADDNTKLLFKTTLQTVRKQSEIIMQQQQEIEQQKEELHNQAE